MGACVSVGRRGKKVAAAAAAAVEGSKADISGKRAPAAEELVPGIWQHLPDDMTRFILTKLPLSSVIHLRRVNKEWNAWILASTVASPFSFNELVDCHVHPIIILLYTLILVRDLDDSESPEAHASLTGRSSLARFIHIRLRLEAHCADLFGWRPRLDPHDHATGL